MAKNVKLVVQNSYVLLDNGLVKLTILKPQGIVAGIKYGGLENLLDLKSGETGRGYWDINWSLPGGHPRYQQLTGTVFGTIHSSNDKVEVSFKSIYNASTSGIRLPLTFDLRYILKSGDSGFYCYGIYERPPGCRAFDLAQTRMVFKLQRERFHYMAITDEKQRIMPMPEDMDDKRSKQLIVPESRLLTNPINPDLKGEVDDKYQYSMDNKDAGVHGWISSGPIIGFWVIFPSQEFRNGGPTKQNLTVHTGPNCLAMFHGTHYIGDDISAHFEEGETWRKVLGPFFVYLNSTPSVSKAYNLWSDAKKQRLFEESEWPYVSDSLIPAQKACVGLSAARTEGSWQTESKDYQFWVPTDSNGKFTIKNVIPGIYALHGWVPGFIGDYLDQKLVTITAGSEIQLGNLIYAPDRDGPTVWEIGYPDRTALGYYVPDVNPTYVNKLFLHSTEKYRQYGLWDRYTDMHPESDQTFTIGINDPKKDWFFAHVDRRVGDKYYPSTWRIKFNLKSVASGIYKLRLATASVNRSDLEVYVNHRDNNHQVFEVQMLGMDNAVCRHGIHGLYRLFNIDISSELLTMGDNSILLTQAREGDALCGVLYDYLRLEAPVNNSGI
ncbi:Rhamnogalacturonan endolyase [Heracleum sosnowskyi]|uniref:rhamnogalacturonan endolyase n=1 Tax=Heracleum sosnowskyi TaxID=360622 RepID=A0AAD8HZ92_9APIA|nr:Rhamnogalacturonan endolyase [Heracleum sosnowskyi]